MLLGKANLQVVRTASADTFDKGMRGVRIEPDGSTVGMSQRMVMAVAPVDRSRVHFSDVGPEADPGQSGLVISLEQAQEVLSNIPKDKRVSLLNAAMTVAHDTRKVEFTTVDARGAERRSADFPVRDPYPPWRQAFDKARGEGQTVKVCVNRKDLIALLQALEAACPDKGDNNPVFLEVGHGIILRCKNWDTGQAALGVCSVYNTAGQWLEETEWEQALSSRKDVRSVKQLTKRRIPTPIRRMGTGGGSKTNIVVSNGGVSARIMLKQSGTSNAGSAAATRLPRVAVRRLRG